MTQGWKVYYMNIYEYLGDLSAFLDLSESVEITIIQKAPKSKY